MSNWPRKPVSSVVDAVIDYRGKTPPRSVEGIPIISAMHVKRGRVEHCGERFVSQETYDKWSTRGFIKPGDVLITTEAPIGEVARVPNDQTYLITQRVIAMQIDPVQACERFLMYSLLADSHRKALANLGHGATVSSVFKEDVLGLEIPMPDIYTQQRIGSVLGAFDYLVENNRRRIEILEEAARLLYREWFMHCRFPGHEDVELVDSDLGPIPDGWETCRLGDVLELAYGKALKADDRKGGPIGVYGSGGHVGWHDQALVAGPGIVVGRKGNVGSVHWSDHDFFPIDTTYYVKSDLPLRFLDQILRTQEFIDSHAAVPGLSRDQAYGLIVAKPEERLLFRYESAVRPMYDLRCTLSEQNTVLSEARDLLLPRLVSGELDVSELGLELEALGV